MLPSTEAADQVLSVLDNDIGNVDLYTNDKTILDTFTTTKSVLNNVTKMKCTWLNSNASSAAHKRHCTALQYVSAEQYYYGAVLPRRRPHHVLILSVCLSVCLSVPCLHLEGKRKGLRIPNLVGRVPGTPAPCGPISRSRGQRSRSRRLIPLLAKNNATPTATTATPVGNVRLSVRRTSFCPLALEGKV